MPPSPDTDPEIRRHEHAARWETLCQTAQHLMTTQPCSQNAAARQLGVPPASLHRELKRYAAGGYEALLPRQKENSGRPSVREKLAGAIGAEAFAALEKQVVGTGLDMDGSDGAAWRKLARRPDAPSALKEYFAKVETRHASKHSIARSLRAATRIMQRALGSQLWQPARLNLSIPVPPNTKDGYFAWLAATLSNQGIITGLDYGYGAELPGAVTVDPTSGAPPATAYDLLFIVTSNATAVDLANAEIQRNTPLVLLPQITNQGTTTTERRMVFLPPRSINDIPDSDNGN